MVWYLPKKRSASQPPSSGKKVNADDEGVENILRRSGAICLRQIQEQRRDEEDGEDVPHPVKAEALAAFVADDVADLFRDRRVRIGHAAARGR